MDVANGGFDEMQGLALDARRALRAARLR